MKINGWDSRDFRVGCSNKQIFALILQLGRVLIKKSSPLLNTFGKKSEQCFYSAAFRLKDYWSDVISSILEKSHLFKIRSFYFLCWFGFNSYIFSFSFNSFYLNVFFLFTLPALLFCFLSLSLSLTSCLAKLPLVVMATVWECCWFLSSASPEMFLRSNLFVSYRSTPF